MAITYRQVKGAPLTAAEYDASLLTLAKATDLPPQTAPTGPAVIASRTTLQQTGATLAYLLGDNFSPNVDASTQLNAVFPDMADGGIQITDPQGKDLLIAAQVPLYSGLNLLTPITRFRRSPDYVPPGALAVQSARAAMFVNQTDGVRLSNIKWHGGIFDVEGGADIDVKGSFFTVECDDFDMADWSFANWQQGHVMFGRGDRCTARNIRFTTPDLDESVESSGWRWSQGDFCTFNVAYGHASNDVLMWVLAMQAGGTDWLRHCRYVNCVTKSDRAKGAGTIGASENGGPVEVAGDPGSQYQGGIYACGFDGCRAEDAGSNFYRIIADGSARRDMIDMCFINGATGNLTSDNAGTDALEIEGLAETAYSAGVWTATGSGYGSIGTILLNNIACAATNTNDANVITAPGARIFINGMRANAMRATLKVNAAKLVDLSGPLQFTGLDSSDGSGDANEKHVVKTDTAFTGEIVFHSKPIIKGVPSTKSAFKIRGGTVRLLRGAECYEATGATTTAFADVAAGATLEYLNDITGTVDSFTPTGAGTITVLNGNTFTSLVNGGGTEALPSYAFLGDLNTGMYQDGADQLAFAAGGVRQVRVTTTALRSAQVLWGPNGGAGAPTFAFDNDSDSGMYRIGADQVGFSVGGTLKVTLAAATVTLAVPLAGPGYTVATLPAAPAALSRAFVTDAVARVYGGAPAGGGALVTPVFWSGAAWLMG